jgi:hypothetical protein
MHEGLFVLVADLLDLCLAAIESSVGVAESMEKAVDVGDGRLNPMKQLNMFLIILRWGDITILVHLTITEMIQIEILDGLER